MPHGLNVLSNVGFVLAGAWAFVRVARSGLTGWEHVAGGVFATGLVLTALGSAWYHLAPSNATLVWKSPATVGAVVLGVPGVELVGPLPAELQNRTDFVFWAGVGASAKEAEVASAFIKYLLTSDAARAIKAKGVEPGSE